MKNSNRDGVMFDFDEDKDNPIGSLLHYHREKRKLDLERVSEDLKIRQDYVEAMEQGRFNLLPTGIYRRSFVKAYSEYLKLDTDNILKILDDKGKPKKKAQVEHPPASPARTVQTVETVKPVEEQSTPKAHVSPMPNVLKNRVSYWFSIFLGLLIGALCVIFLFGIGIENRQSTTIGQAPVEAESLTVVPEPPDTMELFLNLLDEKIGKAPELVFRIEAAGRSWIQIFSDGTELYTGFINENMRVEFKTENELSINIGVNQGVRIILNGFELVPLEKGITRIGRENFSAFIPIDRANEIVRTYESNHGSYFPKIVP
jgi:hypothetical protein